MSEKLEKLKSILNSFLKWFPDDIKPKYERLLPLEVRSLNLGEKMDLYSFAQEANGYVPRDNLHSIGEFLSIVDELSA